MEQLVGQMINRYQITQLLGEGGMGAVLKGYDVTLQRDVAVKVMHPQFTRQPEFRDRFLQEARTAAHLDHPGIVKVFDFGSVQSMLYIVMEFVPGENLRKLLDDLQDTKKWILLNEAVQLVRQVALALDYAHKRGILHRDIKPANIMLKTGTAEGLAYQPVLTDLGLAKLLEGVPLTQDGTSMGTPAYMSPEQALGEKTDPRSDVYSLGVLLYELAVGRLPFPIKTLTEAIRYHTKEPPPPPRSIRPDLPPAIEQVILKSMGKAPADRYASAADLAKALQGVSSTATQVDVTPSTVVADNRVAAVSLVTTLDRTPEADRLNPPNLTAVVDTTKDSLQIVTGNQKPRLIVIEKNAITIGRGADNDIPLEDQKTSRRHVEIRRQGVNYTVVDQKSTNGTFLGGARLLPGVPEAWSPEVDLRIGDTWIRLLRPSQMATSLGGQAAGAALNVSRALPIQSPGSVVAGIELTVTPTQPVVEPGKSTMIRLTLVNQSPLVDHYVLKVEGVPRNWLGDWPPQIQLMPGQQQDLELTIQPPRLAQSRAGRHPMVFTISSQSSPDKSAQDRATLTVAPFSQFSSDLQPSKIQSNHLSQVKINNRGNTQETFAVRFRDRGDELAFTPNDSQVNVPEGQTGILQFKAKPKQNRLFGGEKVTPFETQVTLAKGEPQVLPGELVSRGLVPAWLLTLLIVGCLLCGGGGAVAGGYVYLKNSHATETAVAYNNTVVAQVTSLVVSTQAQATSLKATADSLTATANSLTATAKVPTITGTPLPSATSTLTLVPSYTPSPLPLVPTNTPVPTSTSTPVPTDTPVGPTNTAGPIFRVTRIVPGPILLPFNWKPPIAMYTNRSIYNLWLSGAGTISVSATWSGSQSSLALIINGPGQTGYYARQDGGSGIATSYAVSSADFSSGDTWQVSIVSFGSGTAQGTVVISYPSGKSLPAFSGTFTISSNYAENTSLFIPNRTGNLSAQATWSGSPASLALILNGPNQVGYYARQDGGSPLSLAYSFQSGDLSSGSYWRISLVSFAAANLTGTLDLTFP